MSTLPTLTLDEYGRFLEAWSAAGADAEQQLSVAANALAELALRLAAPAPEVPIVFLAGPGAKGAAGLAAARLLHERGVPLRVVLAGPLEHFSPQTMTVLNQLRASGVPPWGLSLPQDEIDAQEPIHWLSVALLVDALLDADLAGDPEDEVADLIRIANATRRPILSLDVPSGVSGDEGYILSPCVKATATLALGLPRRGVVEAAAVSGDLWLEPVRIPELIWDSLRLPVYPPLEKALIHLGHARGLRPAAK